MYLIGALMLIFATAGVIIFLIDIPNKEILYIIVSAILLILSVSFMKLRTFMYEDSGEVITIKRFHPLENKLHCETVEFPAKQLKDYGIKKTLQGYSIALTLVSLRKKEVRREFLLTGFGRRQLNSLRSSLEHTKQMNLNSF